MTATVIPNRTEAEYVADAMEEAAKRLDVPAPPRQQVLNSAELMIAAIHAAEKYRQGWR